MFWSFHPLADKTNNKHLPTPFSRSYKNRSNRLVQRFGFRRLHCSTWCRQRAFFFLPHSRRIQKTALLTGWLSGTVEVLHHRTVFFCPFVFSFSLKFSCFDKTLQCFHYACFEVHIVPGEISKCLQLFPTIFVGNFWGQQMRNYTLLLGFKGLTWI